MRMVVTAMAAMAEVTAAAIEPPAAPDADQFTTTVSVAASA